VRATGEREQGIDVVVELLGARRVSAFTFRLAVASAIRRVYGDLSVIPQAGCQMDISGTRVKTATVVED